MRFQNLPDVHTRRNAQRIQNDLDRSAVRKVRHIFLRNDARDDALVAMPAGHLVANGQLALHGDIDFDQLDYARRQLVALLELLLALLGDLAQHVDLPRGHFLDLFDFLDEQRILFIQFQALQVAGGDFLDDVASQLHTLDQQPLVGLLVVQVGLQNLAAQQIRKTLQALVGQDADFVRQVLFQLEDLRGFDGLVPLVFFSALAGEDLNVDDGALDARRAVERRVANVAGLFAEDGAQQLLFRSQRGLALRRDLANQDVARLHNGANPNHAAFVQIAQERLADVRNVASYFLGTQLRVARFDFILLDVNRSVVIVLDQLFADQDGVFEVVSTPWQERHQDVAAQRQLAAIGARTVRENLRFLHAVAYPNQWLLADASVLVRTLELDELIDVRAHFAAQHAGVIGLHAHDDALRVDLVHDAFALAQHDGSGIASSHALHTGSHQRSLAANQRHGLALHVRTHQRAVGVVVLEERDEAGGHRNKLLRRNVHVVHFFAALEHEVAGLPAVHEFRNNFQSLVELHVGLRHHVLVFFPCGKVEAVRFVDHLAALKLFVKLFDAVALHDFAGFEFAIAGVDDVHVVDDAPALDLAVRRLDEAVVIDARKAGQRAD